MKPSRVIVKRKTFFKFPPGRELAVKCSGEVYCPQNSQGFLLDDERVGV
jgi:hypothetical protein